MSKKNKLVSKKSNSALLTEGNEVNNLIRIVGLVSILFIAFYLITYFVTKKPNKVVRPTETTIQYSEILVGGILSQSGKEYYVLAISAGDTSSEYATYKETYESNHTTGIVKTFLKTYSINLGSLFNRSFVAKTSNLKVTDLKDILFKDTTLIYVKDKKIISYYEGKDAIINYYKVLIK